MRIDLRVSNALLATLVACGLAACAGNDTNSDAAEGSGGQGGGTTTTGGTSGTTTPGSSGGTTATGVGGTNAETDGTLCPPPAQALITDFTYTPSGDGSTSTTEVRFGNAGTLSGGEYVYPTSGTYPLTSDVTGSSWHISGTVGDYSGFGLYLDACSRIDASAYRGISFQISGTVAQDNMVTLEVGTLNDTITAAWLNDHGGTANATDPGRCVPADSAANQWAQSDCLQPQASIPVTATPTVQQVLWADFVGGKPEASVQPSDILGIVSP